MVKPTRRTQPLRKALDRQRTLALENAQRGRAFGQRNPQDTRRALAKKAKRPLRDAIRAR